MHFVKKVPTTDEERLAKSKERQAKLSAFVAIRDKVFSKRLNDEKDEEQLVLLEKVLSKNPDIYTFWNIRREVIQHMENDIKEKQVSDDSSQRIARLLDNELQLTEICIKNNLKSYSAWHHRGWVLARYPNAHFPQELSKCEQLLMADCRNFHCWDHRRTVATMAGTSNADELEFSKRMVNHNFSNYSAWHYRGTLLQRVERENSGAANLNSETLAAELEKLESAFWMDSDDQTAWVYFRWLLEMDARRIQGSGTVDYGLLTVTYHRTHTIVVFSKAVDIAVVKQTVRLPDPTAQWLPLTTIPTSRCKSARIWFIRSTDCPTVIAHGGDEIAVTEGSHFVDRHSLREIFTPKPVQCSKPVEDAIRKCREDLLKIEPDNVWVVYTITLYLMLLKPNEAHEEILANLERLATTLDPMRSRVYLNLRDRQVIAHALSAKCEESDLTILEEILNGNGCLRLVEQKLTSLQALWPLAGLITTLDVSENALKSVKFLHCFRGITHLTASGNPIEKIACVEIENLEFLCLARCPLQLDSACTLLEEASKRSQKLRFVCAETPISEYGRELIEACKNSEDIRVIPYWL